MKKKSLFLLLLVGMVGLFIPKEVFAIELKYIAGVDYRFFIEDQDEKDVDNLKFKLHDVNNIISYESEYDPNTKAYYFIDIPVINSEDSFERVNSKLLPDGFYDELKNYDYLNLQQDWNKSVRSLASKYSSVDAYVYPMFQKPNGDFSGPLTFRVYIPMILEEISGKSNNSIKKIFFGEFLLIPLPYFSNGNSDNLYFQLLIINNTCTYINSGMPDVFFNQLVYPMLQLTRKNAYDYSDDLMQKFTSGKFASTEINSNNYLNKCFNNDRFATSEIPSTASGETSGSAFTDFFASNMSSNTSSDEPKVQLLRSSSDNISENIIKDYCDCLPVFVQQRKAKSIVQVITNPKTWNNGVIALVILTVMVAGMASIVLIKRKEN